jgi:hypothetical protein
MEQPIIMTAIQKLVLAGEQAGFTVEQMIQMLQTGATVEILLSLIELRLCPSPASPSSRWVM